MSLPILGDLWDAFHGIFAALPKEVKFLFALAVFFYAGAILLNALIFIWNLVVINAINLANGCGADASLCIPALNGIFFFGINFADYWVITGIIFFPMLILFAIKWYALMLPKN